MNNLWVTLMVASLTFILGGFYRMDSIPNIPKGTFATFSKGQNRIQESSFTVTSDFAIGSRPLFIPGV